MRKLSFDDIKFTCMWVNAINFALVLANVLHALRFGEMALILLGETIT